MDNREWEIRKDYAKGQDVLAALSEADRAKVNGAIDGLKGNPWPKGHGAKEVGENRGRISVPVDDDEITILYKVDGIEQKIDIVTIKRRGAIRRATEWLVGLTKFEPKAKP